MRLVVDLLALRAVHLQARELLQVAEEGANGGGKSEWVGLGGWMDACHVCVWWRSRMETGRVRRWGGLVGWMNAVCGRSVVVAHTWASSYQDLPVITHTYAHTDGAVGMEADEQEEAEELERLLASLFRMAHEPESVFLGPFARPPPPVRVGWVVVGAFLLSYLRKGGRDALNS